MLMYSFLYVDIGMLSLVVGMCLKHDDHDEAVVNDDDHDEGETVVGHQEGLQESQTVVSPPEMNDAN